MKKIKIGIVGEHPQHDADALRILLAPMASEGVQFKIITKRLRGSDFDDEQNGGASKRFLKILETEYEDEALNMVIFIRDADTILTDSIRAYQHKRDAWFKQANKTIHGKGIFFLAIYEMEALILSDSDTLKKLYGVSVKTGNNPMFQTNAKEHLQRLTDKSKRGRYEENHAPDVFKSLNFKAIYDHHKGERSFQAFADELVEKKILDEKKIRTPQY